LVTSPLLSLVHGRVAIPLGGRPVQIGRLPECDVLLDSWEISRRHARIIPTPAGPLLVDGSRFGTFLNGLRIVAPTLLYDGDLIRIGDTELRVSSQPAAPSRVPRSALAERFSGWWQRFGLAELGGMVAAVGSATLVLHRGGGLWLAALAGALAETFWFYVALAIRDLRSARPGLGLGDVVVNLAREFGVAEGIDLFTRPLWFGLGLWLLPSWAGALLGKVIADLVFYGPVLSLWHWRLASRSRIGADLDRLRATTSVNLPAAALRALRDTPTTDPHKPEAGSGTSP
jgi:hypothetical protein